MRIVYGALALLSGVVGAGFASGREIARFFSGHGAASVAAIVLCVFTLLFLFLRLSEKLEKTGAASVSALCRARFGERIGRLSGGLFFTLSAVTGGTMLAACAELTALTLPLRHAYALGMAVSLAAALLLALKAARGLAAAGGVLVVLLPALLCRLLALPAGEACFLPAMSPDLPVRAAADGAIYAALNAAMLFSAAPQILCAQRAQRKKTVLLFCILFGGLLLLGSAVCSRHMQAVWDQPLPFVTLSRQLGAGGYLLVAASMYAAALSTLCAMLLGMLSMLPYKKPVSAAVCAALCVCVARFGFGALVQSAYPVLGAVCGALLLLLCL